MPGDPPTTQAADRHLWVSAGRAGQPAGDVGGLDDVGPGAAAVEADVGDLDGAGERPAGLEQQPRLEGGERDGAVGPHRGRRRLAGEAVDARRDVGRQHRRGAGIGGVVVAPEAGAVGGVDHEVARREPLPTVEVGGVEDLHGDAPPAQPGGGVAPVGAVVALAGDDDDPAPVRAAEHPDAPRRPAPHRPARRAPRGARAPRRRWRPSPRV